MCFYFRVETEKGGSLSEYKRFRKPAQLKHFHQGLEQGPHTLSNKLYSNIIFYKGKTQKLPENSTRNAGKSEPIKSSQFAPTSKSPNEKEKLDIDVKKAVEISQQKKKNIVRTQNGRCK